MGLSVSMAASLSAYAGPVAAPPPPVAVSASETEQPVADHSRVTADLINNQGSTDADFWERLSEAAVDDINKVRKSSGLSSLQQAAADKNSGTPKKEEFVSPDDIMKAVRNMSRGHGNNGNNA